MNSKERVLKTLKLLKPDCVPIALYENLVGANMLNMPFGKIFLDGKLLAQSRFVVYEEFGIDIIDIETGVTTVAEACGCIVEYPDDAAPWIKKSILGNLHDISKLQIPDSNNSKAMYANLEAVNIVSNKIGKEVFIIGEADQGPFSLAGELRGMADFYMDLVFEENRKYVHELLEYTTNVVLNYARELMNAGADAICIGESAAGPNLISPEYYELFAKPYDKRLVQVLNKEGIPVIIHMCGQVDKILDSIIDTGAAVIEIDEKTNLNLAKDKCRNKTTIFGAITPATLTFGSKNDIEEEISRNLEICMPDYGYILAPGCTIGANTPLENIRTFVEFGRKYGRY